MLFARNSSQHQAKAVQVRDAGNAPRSAKTIRVRDASNVSRLVFQSMGASASPVEVTGIRNTAGSTPATTSLATAAPVGGTGPYTYAWTAGDVGWTVNSPSAATTSFTHEAGPGEYYSATMTCTVTDATGASAQAFVTASVQNIHAGSLA